MALTANRDIDFFTSNELIDLAVDDNVLIYKGALVGRNRATGFVRPLVAGDEFVGVAYRQADNTVAGHTAGGISARLFQTIDIVHPLSGVATADIGRPVYASDDETLTLNNVGSRVGRVVAVETTNTARVRCTPIATLDGALEPLPAVTLPDQTMTLTLDHMNRVLTMPNTAARVLTLPPVAQVGAGGWFTLIKTSAAAAAIALDGNASETIDGSATFIGVDAIYDSALLICTGTQWVIASRDLA